MSDMSAFCTSLTNTVQVVRDLKERGLLFKHEVYRHEYPFCPRADNRMTQVWGPNGLFLMRSHS